MLLPGTLWLHQRFRLLYRTGGAAGTRMDIIMEPQQKQLLGQRLWSGAMAMSHQSGFRRAGSGKPYATLLVVSVSAALWRAGRCRSANALLNGVLLLAN